MQTSSSIFLSGFLATAALLPGAAHCAIDLKTAGNFGVLAATTVTSTGPSVIYQGDLGLQPGSSITGFPPAVVLGSTHIGDLVAQAAQADLASAYGAASGLASTRNLSGLNLGGMTLSPGVYSFSSDAALAGTLILDGRGDPMAQFIFKVGTSLTTASLSAVSVINNGIYGGNNVFWQVGSSATLGTDSQFAGNILAYSSITLNHSADILYGSALALNGAVTLDDNSITKGLAVLPPVPEPETFSLFLSGGLLLLIRRLRLRNNRGFTPATNLRAPARNRRTPAVAQAIGGGWGNTGMVR